jgi:hypothetical protein
MNQAVLLKEIEKVPAGEWIVLAPDETRIITHNVNLSKAIEEACRQGVDDPVVMKAAPCWTSFVI